MNVQEPKVGDVVVYHDPTGQQHNSLVTAVWPNDVANVVFVSGDESRHDDYGRQIERETSVSHVSKTPVHGRYWRRSEEPPNPYTPPVSV